jgi:hypothetical protein
MICGYTFNIRNIIKHLFFDTVRTIFGKSGGLDVKWAVFHIQSNLVT